MYLFHLLKKLLFIHHSFSDSLNPLSFMEKDRNKFFRKRLKDKQIHTNPFFPLILVFFYKKLNHCTFECTLCVPFFIIKKKGFDFEIFHLNCFLNFFFPSENENEKSIYFSKCYFQSISPRFETISKNWHYRSRTM
jgi:hypothetical protein